MMPPETPLLAGIPTVLSQSPAASYMPQLVITVSTCRAQSAETTCSPVTGWMPPLARVAAITARSRVVTSTEHWRV